VNSRSVLRFCRPAVLPSSRRPDTGAVPAGLVIVVALFLTAIAYIVASSLTRRSQPVYEPSPIAPRPIPPGSTVVDTLTIDARHETTWRFVDFDRRSEVVPPDTVGWDLAFRRFHIIAADAVLDLGPAEFRATPPDSGYVSNRIAGDTTNSAIARWYDYGFMSHLLEPNGHIYAARTPEGRYGLFEILSYYCPGLAAGCVTVRFRYPATR
jgi:hypothetical protein